MHFSASHFFFFDKVKKPELRQHIVFTIIIFFAKLSWVPGILLALMHK